MKLPKVKGKKLRPGRLHLLVAAHPTRARTRVALTRAQTVQPTLQPFLVVVPCPVVVEVIVAAAEVAVNVPAAVTAILLQAKDLKAVAEVAVVAAVEVVVAEAAAEVAAVAEEVAMAAVVDKMSCHSVQQGLFASRLRFRGRMGLTLLEIILALSLTSLILGTIGGAIFTYQRMLKSRSEQSERTRLARATLYMIAEDLQSAYVKKETNVSQTPISLEGVEFPIDEDMLDELGLEEDEGLEVISNEEAAEIDPNAPKEEEEPEEEEVELPGFYGNMNEIRFDISRPLRPEQYNSPTSTIDEEDEESLGGSYGRPTGGINTIAYFMMGESLDATISSPEVVNISRIEFGTQEITSGLLRRVTNRSSIELASEDGDVAELDGQTRLLAPEIVMLEFRYFNGLDWQPEWDSSIEKGFPLAVGIAIAIRTIPDEDDGAPNWTLPEESLFEYTDELEGLEVHQLTVRIPAGELPEEEEEEEAEEGESEEAADDPAAGAADAAAEGGGR